MSADNIENDLETTLCAYRAGSLRNKGAVCTMECVLSEKTDKAQSLEQNEFIFGEIGLQAGESIFCTQGYPGWQDE